MNTRLLFFALFAASAVPAVQSMPQLPNAYSMIVKWTNAQNYEYIHEVAYDLTNQKLSDKSIENNTVVSILVQQPKVDGKQYLYDTSLKTCQKSDFTATIGGGVPYYPTAKNETTEMVDGILADKWTMDLGTYTISVWFTHNGDTPVQMYNSHDNATGAIQGGIKKIQCYFPSVAWDSFQIPTGCNSDNRRLRVATTAATLPKMPQQLSYKISWSSTIAGRTYNYAHFHYYDLDKQEHRDNQLENGCTIVATTVELPKALPFGKAYRYDDKTFECATYNFTSVISAGVLVYPDMYLEKTEEIDGITCNKWTKVFPASPPYPEYNTSVWFTPDGLTPVRIFNSNDLPPTGNINGGFKRISYYSPTVDPTNFAIPKGCAVPP